MPVGGERRRVCDDMRKMIMDDLDTGLTPTEISGRLRVSPQFISDLRKTVKVFGTVHPTPYLKPGP
jgi:hypothetical protein